MSEQDASLFEAPFKHVTERVLPERSQNRRASYRMRWWRHVEPRPALMGKLAQLKRYIVTYHRAITQQFALDVDRIATRLLFVQVGEVRRVEVL